MRVCRDVREFIDTYGSDDRGYQVFCLALAHMLEMCRDHFRSLVMVTPRYLTDSATVVFILCNSYHIAIITNSYVVCTFHLQKFMN